MKAETKVTDQRKAVAVANRVPQWVLPLIRAAVMAVDGIIAAASFIAAFALRESAPVLSTTAWAWSQEFVPYAGILYAAIVIRVAMLVYQRAYRYHGAFSYVHEAVKVGKAVAVGSLLIVAWAFLFRGGFAFREFSYSRSVFVLDFAIALGLFLSFHFFIRFVQTRFRNRGINLIPTLIVGTNAEAVQTINELSERRDLGYRLIGVVATDDLYAVDDIGGVPVVGDVSDLAVYVRDLEIQEVIITDDTVPSELLFDAMMRSGRRSRVEYRFAPKLFDLLPQKTGIEQIGVLPMVRLFREPLSDVQRLVKRTSDIVIAAIAILVTLPIWIVAILIVRFGSRGPVFFKQERVGMDGRIFLCYKFRTMYADADDGVHRAAYRKNIDGETHGDELHGKVRNDPRVTPAGRWLRRWSFDELPQFLNVLKGDMSVVGPRPPIPYEVEDYGIHHRKRLDMKPGITGLWQVSGRSRLSFEEMVRIDLFYIENWSLLLDLKIMLLTFPAVIRGEGER
jgi:exopolysaccharide biosynthesis polyprenyl glycosylphosphotransferase